MKQAFLITAYKDFSNLYELAAFLHTSAYVFIHVDRKSTAITKEQIQQLNELSNCRAIQEYAIAWGGFTHVSAILALMRLACKEGEVSYIHLLTGEDLPLRTMAELDRKYLNCKEIYMDCIDFDRFTPQVQKRYYYHNWFADRNVKNPWLWQLQNLTVNLQKLLGMKRKHLGEFSNEQVWKGLVYVSMPAKAAKYVLQYCDKTPEYLKELRDCQIPEEFFFQTIFMNSKYKKMVAGKAIRYMNWEKGDGGSPAYLDLEDLSEIQQGDYDFARKFGSAESEQLRRELFDGNRFPN